jgi:hypothetical protein
MEISDQRDNIPLREKLFNTHHFCLKAKYRISLSVSLVEAVKGWRGGGEVQERSRYKGRFFSKKVAGRDRAECN